MIPHLASFFAPQLRALQLLMLFLTFLIFMCVMNNARAAGRQISWDQPLVRESGAVMQANEIKAFQIMMNGVGIAQPAGTARTYAQLAGEGVCLPANSKYTIKAQDTDNVWSKESPIVNYVEATCTPKSPPGAPTGVTVTPIP